jgi:hypothetical protein
MLNNSLQNTKYSIILLGLTFDIAATDIKSDDEEECSAYQRFEIICHQVDVCLCPIQDTEKVIQYLPD